MTVNSPHNVLVSTAFQTIRYAHRLLPTCGKPGAATDFKVLEQRACSGAELPHCMHIQLGAEYEGSECRQQSGADDAPAGELESHMCAIPGNAHKHVVEFVISLSC